MAELANPNKPKKGEEDALTAFLKLQLEEKCLKQEPEMMLTPVRKEPEISYEIITPEKQPIQVLYYVSPDYRDMKVDYSITSKKIIEDIEEQAKSACS